MREYFLKRLLPFILTFIVGAAAGGFFQLFNGGDDPFSGRYRYERRGGCAKKYRAPARGSWWRR